jgi:D-tyrosyl-tRNA(Tyr) deacylase
MIALLQRVLQAEVKVKGDSIARIERGLLVLVGVEKNDTEQAAERLAVRLAGYRVFADSQDKMNLSVQDIGGRILLVPQFTLAADTDKGMRPSFHPAAEPEIGRQLFDYLCLCLERGGANIARGRFGADMQVSLINDGPVTFYLRTHSG